MVAALDDEVVAVVLGNDVRVEDPVDRQPLPERAGGHGLQLHRVLQ